MEVMKMMRSVSRRESSIAKITYPLLSAAMDSLGVTEAPLTRAWSLPTTPLPARIPMKSAGWDVYVWVVDGQGYWFSEANEICDMPLYYRKESS